MATLDSLRRTAIDTLTRAGIDSPEADAELLIGHALGISRGEVQSKVVTGAEISETDAVSIRELVARRESREPLQHITGRAPFRNLDLAVGPGVFVPRPETEQVVQFAIDALWAVPVEHPVAVDLGSGSGAIALAMATEVPHSVVYAAENSAEAFPWTSRNFEETAAANAHLVFADLADAFGELDGQVDVAISNPPYIPTDAIPRDPEVRMFDPVPALYSGTDGLDAVRQVSQTGLRLLHSGGTLVIEHGELQAGEIAALLRADGWSAVSSHRDLLGRDRATTALR